MKVAYNECYGGFSLSKRATIRYWEIKGTPPPDHWYSRNADRADPVLIRVIEELGADANGDCASLCIRDVPSGSLWRIDEYDGAETVVLQDEYDWRIAD